MTIEFITKVAENKALSQTQEACNTLMVATLIPGA